jgi:pyridoxal phosphate enzyme (YggS family)
MNIQENITGLKSLLPSHVKLVAVSKFKPNEAILKAYEVGQRDFGENYVQELVEKAETLPKDINWHFIGHLQSNKVKYIAPFVHLIHAVDSLKLLKEINKQAANNNRIIDCLLQIHIAKEETKSGMSEADFLEILKSEDLKSLENVRILGVMGMSTFTEDVDQVKSEFKTLTDIFKEGQEIKPELKEISMGMSGDFEAAIAAGSTIVRIGSTIFGAR